MSSSATRFPEGTPRMIERPTLMSTLSTAMPSSNVVHRPLSFGYCVSLGALATEAYAGSYSPIKIEPPLVSSRSPVRARSRATKLGSVGCCAKMLASTDWPHVASFPYRSRIFWLRGEMRSNSKPSPRTPCIPDSCSPGTVDCSAFKNAALMVS